MYHCEHCQYATVYKHNLTRHYKTHLKNIKWELGNIIETPSQSIATKRKTQSISTKHKIDLGNIKQKLVNINNTSFQTISMKRKTHLKNIKRKLDNINKTPSQSFTSKHLHFLHDLINNIVIILRSLPKIITPVCGKKKWKKTPNYSI